MLHTRLSENRGLANSGSMRCIGREPDGMVSFAISSDYSAQVMFKAKKK